MNAARRLYDPGFEAWDHSASGYITDYMIAIECLVFAIHVLMKMKTRTGAKHFIVYAILAAIAFGAKGLAHHMLDIYYQNGEVMHHEWGEANAGWMYPWLVTSLIPIAAAASAAEAFEFTLCGHISCIYVMLYTIGSLVSLYEVWGLVNEQTGTSGMWTAFVSIAFGLVGLIFALLGMRQFGADRNRVLVGCGSFSWLLAFVFYKFLVPDVCRAVSEEKREDCPFPPEFNDNAVFHVIIIVAVTCSYLAVQQGAAKVVVYDPDELTETKDDELTELTGS